MAVLDDECGALEAFPGPKKATTEAKEPGKPLEHGDHIALQASET